ncbi:hypothetical protein Tamer19_47970 [Cupriavidus sp. TA19]|nr:hypothetical protein Tamer19_47970 [Cupriavidus sp. TA19]
MSFPIDLYQDSVLEVAPQGRAERIEIFPDMAVADRRAACSEIFGSSASRADGVLANS